MSNERCGVSPFPSVAALAVVLALVLPATGAPPPRGLGPEGEEAPAAVPRLPSARRASSSSGAAAGAVAVLRAGRAPGAAGVLRGGEAARTTTPDPGCPTCRGGTACRCQCGERVVWSRQVFKGDVVAQKEHECEHEVCPSANIPGLMVHTSCHYVEDVAELRAGTICSCQCGDKAVWRGQTFYGNVSKAMEARCLEHICPRVSPVPGLLFEARCRFEPRLFDSTGIHSAAAGSAGPVGAPRRRTATAWGAGHMTQARAAPGGPSALGLLLPSLLLLLPPAAAARAPRTPLTP